MKEFTTAYDDVVTEDSPEEKYVEFTIDGRNMRAYQPHEGQLTFMLANLGRGQTSDQRFAAIINIMLSSLRDDDRDYMESRLLTRDPAKRLPVKTIEAVFEYLTEEWFRPSVSDGSEAVPDRG